MKEGKQRTNRSRQSLLQLSAKLGAVALLALPATPAAAQTIDHADDGPASLDEQSILDLGNPNDEVTVEIFSDSREPRVGLYHYLIASDGTYSAASLTYMDTEVALFMVPSLELSKLGEITGTKGELASLSAEELCRWSALVSGEEVPSAAFGRAVGRALAREQVLVRSGTRGASSPLGRGERIWRGLMNLVGRGDKAPLLVVAR